MPTPAHITIDTAFPIAPIDPRLYGSFIEHVGRAVSTGIHEPDHPTADDLGFRQDVLALVKELNVPLVRYPGGNFLSGYDWEDGVGPVDERPTWLDLAWMTTEPNIVGTNEFAAWAKRAGTDVNLAVNLGTRGLDAARHLVEYCNHPGGTAYSDLRRAHGVDAPHGFKLWCLGNEMDALWQIGHKTAHEYGRLAHQTALTMKWVDPTIELVACGSSNATLPTFPDWELTVLDHTFDAVDYISLHAYPRKHGDDLGTFLARAIAFDQQIQTVVAACDLVQARKRSTKQIHIAADEWNVWYHRRDEDRQRLRDDPWQIAPAVFEEAYTLEDALVVGSMLITLLKHADRVKIACLAQLVNVLAPISTVPGGPAWRQTTYYPFLHAARHGHGVALHVPVTSPTYPTAEFDAVPLLDAVATHDEETGALTIFAINRGQTASLPLTATLHGFAGYTLTEHLTLTDDNSLAVNTATHPDTVTPRPHPGTSLDNGTLTTNLQPLSWNMIRLTR